ncbi:hypothetical protein DdX_17320 [Ditylenchus destructor]|uniref:Uncharacterized protein n=1 Tax=Ditylenchus destructor TaxID=166010 RepID=A0AAD4MNU4_9BILA|nr:hypothetical protein DdX_17320 [Ditylenchus destructor]
MNRSTLLLFLCVFALSEVLLAAKKARIRGVVGVKNSTGVRLPRSARCVTDDQCDKVCKFGSGASGENIIDVGDGYTCVCDDDWTPVTKETCVASCDILGLGGGKFDDDEDCVCNPCK